MAYICEHHRQAAECLSCHPPALNVDRHGMPRDFATYEWLLYKRSVTDESPERMTFLHGPRRDGMLRAIPPGRDTR